MNAVNTELHSSPETSDRDNVARLFGAAPNVVLKAVGNFLRRRPGLLDHHNLRIIATAAPHIRDPKIVAEMIDHLPVTRMHLAAQPIDLQQARAQFELVLPVYQPRVRQRLVDDLVTETTLQFLEFSPPARLTPEARQVVEDHLLDLARGDDSERAAALSSPFATAQTVRAALDSIGRRVVGARRGTPNRQSQMLPLAVVIESVAAVFYRDARLATSADVERAWQLAEQCEHDDPSLRRLLWAAASCRNLSPELTRTVLDAIDRLPSSRVPDSDDHQIRRSMRGAMMSVPEMPEDLALLAARRGFRRAILPGRVRDHRWFALRAHEYKGWPRRPIEPLSSDELDRRISELPAHALSRDLVQMISDGEALRRLAGRASRFDDGLVRELIHHQHMPLDVTFGQIKTEPNLIERVFGGAWWQRDGMLMGDPRLDDEKLVQLLRAVDTDDFERHDDFLDSAVINPSAGNKLLDYLIEIDKAHLHLPDLAEVTTDPRLHRKLADRAVELMQVHPDKGAGPRTRATQIADALITNGTVSTDVIGAISDQATPTDPVSALFANRTRPVGPRQHQTGRLKRLHLPAHDPRRIASMVIGGVVPEDRVDWLIYELRHGTDASTQLKLEEAMSMFAEAGLLSNEHWKSLTLSDDRHVAMTFATHPLCPTEASSVRTAAVDRLGATAEAVRGGVSLPSASNLRRWSQLPNGNDVPFPASAAADALDGQTVSGRELRIVRTPGELKKIAREMGNCLGGYQDSIESGQRIVGVVEEPGETTAIAWDVSMGSAGEHRLSVVEVNTRFNTGNVDPNLRTALDELVAKLATGDLQPVRVATTAPSDDLPDPDTRDQPTPVAHLDARDHLDARNPPDTRDQPTSADQVVRPVDQVIERADENSDRSDRAPRHAHPQPAPPRAAARRRVALNLHNYDPVDGPQHPQHPDAVAPSLLGRSEEDLSSHEHNGPDVTPDPNMHHVETPEVDTRDHNADGLQM